MKYYYLVHDSIKKSKSTSFLHINSKTLDLSYDEQGYLDYSEPLSLLVRGEERETCLYFPFYEKSINYIDLMTYELKSVLEQFNLPEHKWYKAEAGYDLKLINRMKKIFNTEYDIDLNEKRGYWVLQILDKKIEKLAFELIDFQLNDYDTFTFKSRKYLGVGAIKTYEDYRQVRKTKIQANNSYPEPSVYKYQKNYDILWGGVHIVFNEKVKKALEATSIITPENGLQFAEFTDYEIEMLGESI